MDLSLCKPLPRGELRKRRAHRILRRAASRARDRLYTAIDGAVGRLAQALPRRAAAGKRSRIAIILVHGIGDLVIWRGAHQKLRAEFPADRFEITLFCMDRSLEFARAYIDADRFVTIERERFRTLLPYREAILWRAARQGFDLALQPSFNRYLLVEDALVRATRAPRRIGSAGTSTFIRDRERRISDAWYTQIVPASPHPIHDLSRSVEFLAGIGIDVPARLMPLPPPVPARVAADPYVIFAIGTSSPLKTWPLERFEALAHLTARRTGCRIVFAARPAMPG